MKKLLLLVTFFVCVSSVFAESWYIGTVPSNFTATQGGNDFWYFGRQATTYTAYTAFGDFCAVANTNPNWGLDGSEGCGDPNLHTRTTGIEPILGTYLMLEGTITKTYNTTIRFNTTHDAQYLNITSRFFGKTAGKIADIEQFNVSGVKIATLYTNNLTANTVVNSTILGVLVNKNDYLEFTIRNATIASNDQIGVSINITTTNNPNPPNINGTVKYNGNVFENATVQVVNFSSNASLGNTTSNILGKYNFSVVSGEYLVNSWFVNDSLYLAGSSYKQSNNLSADSTLSLNSYNLQNNTLSYKMCYQESANVSNQSGTDGVCGLNYNGNYSYSNESGIVYVNYTKPNFAIGAIWQYKMGDVFQNSSLNDNGCFGNILKLNMSINLCVVNRINSGCINSTNYLTLYSKNSGSTICGGSTGFEWPYLLFDGDYSSGQSFRSNGGYWWNEVIDTDGIYEEGIWWNVSTGGIELFEISDSGTSGDSCMYSGSGNWAISNTSCNITINTNVFKNNLTIYNSTVNINATITNYTLKTISNGSIVTRRT